MIDKPETIDELCDYIMKYQDDIFLRAQVDGKWGPVALSALPAKEAIGHTLRFIRAGIIPVRVTRKEVLDGKVQSAV